MSWSSFSGSCRTGAWSARSSAERAALDAPVWSAPFQGEVVVGVRLLGCGPICLGHVAQVDADAVPQRGAPAHAVDQHVVLGEQLGDLGVPLLPALEAVQRIGLLLGL